MRRQRAKGLQQAGVAAIQRNLAILLERADAEQGVMVDGNHGRRALRQCGNLAVHVGVDRGARITFLEAHVTCIGGVEDEQRQATAQWHSIGIGIIPRLAKLAGRAFARGAGHEWMGIKKTPPALAGARTGFMVPACHDPRGRREQSFAGCKKIRFPRAPAVTVRATRAPLIVGPAGRLAVMIVPHVNDQVGMPGRGAGGDRGEWVRLRVVAILVRGIFQAATRIADDDDPLWLRDRQWQRLPGQRRMARAGRDRRFAGQDGDGWRLRRARRNGRPGCAHSHLHGHPVQRHGRALCIGRQRAHGGGAIDAHDDERGGGRDLGAGQRRARGQSRRDAGKDEMTQ